MTSDDGLDVQAVIGQFNESEQTLEELRERLKALVLAEEGAEHAANTIEGASQALTEAANALNAVLAEVQEIRATTVTALEAARHFLQGTDLTALREEVVVLSERIPQVETVRNELEALRARIPERTRKKLGIV